MTIIFAKHDGCDKEFIFEVPAGMYPVRNDVLWVDTSMGETVAVATSDTIWGQKVEQIVERFGAYLPLKKVKAYANKGLQAYIENRTYKEVGEFCQDRQVNVHELEDLPLTYDSLNAPKNKSIWAVAYSINDDTEHHRLMCKPTNGEFDGYSFIPYKVGTKIKRKSGRVSKYARKYADTYEEAVELFNSLVQKRIDNLLEMAEEAKNDFIK